MYTLAVRREFDAQHALIGGDWRDENLPHTHHYLLEFQLSGESFNDHGFLVDIVDVEQHLDSLVGFHSGKMLNDLPEFAGLTPVPHGDDRQRKSAGDYNRAYENAAEEAEQLLVRAGQQLAPKLLAFFPAIIWEDHDECLEVRPEDIAL